MINWALRQSQQVEKERRRFIEETIPHIASLLVNDLAAVVDHGDVLIVGNAAPVFRTLPQYVRPGQVVIDLARIPGLAEAPAIEYRGITW